MRVRVRGKRTNGRSRKHCEFRPLPMAMCTSNNCIGPAFRRNADAQ